MSGAGEAPPQPGAGYLTRMEAAVFRLAEWWYEVMATEVRALQENCIINSAALFLH